MTFSIVGRDPRTGALGMAVTSSSPCVGARCIHLRDGVGAVTSQNITDPTLGPTILDLLESGLGAQQALDRALDSYETARFRQLAVVDAHGAVAHFSGEGTLGTHRVVGGEQVVAAGNLLSSPEVPQRMVDAFTAASGELEERLMAGLQAGEDAGGEMGEVRSCGLAVVHDVGWRVTDIRVDEADQPIPRMAEILELWMTERDAYVTRGLHPDLAPSYGVPGDE
jgi:uncharacterized Ntn-hydrolase superfamily protein